MNADRLRKDMFSTLEIVDHRSSIVVVGYGNPLRSDDGIGRRIAQELRSRLDTSRIQIIECHELTPEMADIIRSAMLVVFVDSAIDGFPGEMRHLRLERSSVAGSIPTLSHGRTPDALMALTANLYGVTPAAHLFTVSGSSFEYGEIFSSAVAQAFPSVLAEVELLLRTAMVGGPTV
jgi:hydrogenase maturation protease